MAEVSVRRAAKAGKWYLKNPAQLKADLQKYLNRVPDQIDDSSLPIPGARIVISPHAGYDFSGPCAAFAYRSLDLSRAKRVFILGPSHTYGLGDCAVTTFGQWATPFGNLTVDTETLAKVQKAGNMDEIPCKNDVDEHSMEMQAPYLYLRMQETFDSPDMFPKIVPFLVGSLSGREEKAIGKVLLPYLKDPENAFVISSDFCHWGDHFSYMPYSATNDPAKLTRLDPDGPTPSPGPEIHETIKLIDEHAMNAVESGSHDAFLSSLRMTRNTVCGRHPIGVAMAAMELLAKENGSEGEADGPAPRFNVIRYDRSELVYTPGQFSVSYVAAYAVI